MIAYKTSRGGQKVQTTDLDLVVDIFGVRHVYQAKASLTAFAWSVDPISRQADFLKAAKSNANSWLKKTVAYAEYLAENADTALERTKWREFVSTCRKIYTLPDVQANQSSVLEKLTEYLAKRTSLSLREAVETT